MEMSSVLAFAGFSFQILSLAIWVGGLIFFAFVTAPLAFKEIPSRSTAGNFTAACLRRFQNVEVPCALLALCGAGFLYVAPVTSPVLWSDIALSVIMFINFMIYSGYLMPRLEALRLQMSETDLYAREVDPVVAQTFQQLHSWYARLMTANIVLGVVLLIVVSVLCMLCGRAEPGVGTETMMWGGAFNPWQ